MSPKDTRCLACGRSSRPRERLLAWTPVSAGAVCPACLERSRPRRLTRTQRAEMLAEAVGECSARGDRGRGWHLAKRLLRIERSAAHLVRAANVASPGARRVELLEEALRLDPENHLARANVVWAIAEAGAYEQALARLEADPAVHGSAPDVSFKRATLLEKLGRLPEARAAIARALRAPCVGCRRDYRKLLGHLLTTATGRARRGRA